MGSGHNSDGYIGVKLGPELRAHALQVALALDMTLSEWIRAVVIGAVSNGGGFAGELTEEHGYIVGRRLGLQLAQARTRDALTTILEDLPISYEEAVTRYGNNPADY